ncbi:MAG TPA: hypothetical protein VKE71_02670, partial [Candidatus Angelobacter sp.]|nr:hypothetical protein [Candidatus Angelobacter sp.]
TEPGVVFLNHFLSCCSPTGERSGKVKNPNVETLHCNVSRAKRGMVFCKHRGRNLAAVKKMWDTPTLDSRE